MTDIVIILVVVAILALAGLYVYKAKKSGQKCIGCPHSKTCASKSCGCGCSDK
ncbi:MAG: FeoB-associated Cys-rich membrane protein [Clostridia bacterium]|nr:FeoB-associated Cys-rich membrane protein [Clostridia bacterium]